MGALSGSRCALFVGHGYFSCFQPRHATLFSFIALGLVVMLHVGVCLWHGLRGTRTSCKDCCTAIAHGGMLVHRRRCAQRSGRALAVETGLLLQWVPIGFDCCCCCVLLLLLCHVSRSAPACLQEILVFTAEMPKNIGKISHFESCGTLYCSHEIHSQKKK